MNMYKMVSLLGGLCLLVLFQTSCTPGMGSGGGLDKIQVYCLGDSITSGYRLPSPATYGYPAQMERMSKYRWKVKNGGVAGATALKAGDKPIWKEQAYKDIMASNPDIVVVILGTNDTTTVNWQKIASFHDDYSLLVKQLQNLPSRPRVFVGAIPPVFSNIHGISNEKARELNHRVRKISVETGAEYIDIATPLAGKPDMYMEDGLHPTVLGARSIADTILMAINKSLATVQS